MPLPKSENKMNQYQKNFKAIIRLLPDLRIVQPGDAFKLKADGFMDLNIDVLERDDVTNTVRISLAHNYIQNGDVMACPDMEIRVLFEMEMAEALTFQMSNPPIFQEVYLPDNRYYPKRKRELNSFLSQWLRNIRAQGHALDLPLAPAAAVAL